jgi:hypothetical protein
MVCVQESHLRGNVFANSFPRNGLHVTVILPHVFAIYYGDKGAPSSDSDADGYAIITKLLSYIFTVLPVAVGKFEHGYTGIFVSKFAYSE